MVENISRVRWSQGSSGIADKEGLPPRRFFVACSS